jgi:hypothetical protein
MRAYFIAIGLTALIIGVPLWFAGYEHIGCSVQTVGGMNVFTNCGGANDLVLGGAILALVGVVCLGLSFIPNDQSRYK